MLARSLLKSKIHRATITDANVDYEGSVAVDASLLELANIIPWERVSIWDVTNGARLETYAIPAPPNSGTICMNGAGAHLMKKGDLIIIASFADYLAEEARVHQPKLIFVGQANEHLNSEHS